MTALVALEPQVIAEPEVTDLVALEPQVMVKPEVIPLMVVVMGGHVLVVVLERYVP